MIPTPFHDRTAALCQSHRWKDWAGFYAVSSYDTCHEREYFAFRHGAGILDVSPLYKYDVTGADAGRFLSYVTTRDVGKLRVGRVAYSCWVDRRGKMLDDGTIARLEECLYRVTSADPMLHWFRTLSDGFDVHIDDTSRSIAALAVQGPTSADLLNAVSDGGVEGLRFFRAVQTTVGGCAVTVTRTGYTGDLGFEVWAKSEDALRVWDVLMDEGRKHGAMAAGLDALDIARVEAGFIMAGVEYQNARHCLAAVQTSSPFEVGLGWTVQLDRGPFVGQKALRAEKASGPKWAMVGLEVDWVEIERAFESRGLPPNLPSNAWRTSVPLYSFGRQIGYATSGTWSPTLKKNLALATVPSRFAEEGTTVDFEINVEFWRKNVRATVVETPFFNPPRKRL
jgi:aminomethyltransferase